MKLARGIKRFIGQRKQIYKCNNNYVTDQFYSCGEKITTMLGGMTIQVTDWME